LNGLPGPGLPINHAVVALLHDDALRLHQTEQRERLQKQEKLRLLEEMERALQKKAINLDVRAPKNRRKVVDLVEEKEELDREEKVWQRAADKILKMELEQDIPARVTPTDAEKMADGKLKVKAVLYTPDETKRKVMMTSGVAIGALALV